MPIPGTIYRITKHFRDGVVIDELIPILGGAPEYYLIMNMETPMGSIVQTPAIDAGSITEAYALSAEVAERVTKHVEAELSKPKIITTNRISGL